MAQTILPTSVDRNRDIALEGLKSNNITSAEWDEMNQITKLSDDLVPIEELAMAAVASGDHTAAINYVFSGEYKRWKPSGRIPW